MKTKSVFISMRLVVAALLMVAVGVGRVVGQTTNSAPVSNVVAAATGPFQSVLSFVESNGHLLPAGVGVTLHGKLGENLAQQVDVIGGGSTNLWRFGAVASTFFAGGVSTEELGVGATFEIQKAPAFVSHFLLVQQWPKVLEIGFSAEEPFKLYTTGPKAYDWKQTLFAAQMGWSF